MTRIIVAITIFLLLWLPIAAFADPPPLGLTTQAEVARVIDGDTLEVRITRTVHVRLLDCWAPETRTTDEIEKAAGLKAKARVVELLDKTGSRVTVLLAGSEDGDLGDVLTMGRVLGRVWLADGRELSEVLVEEGMAGKTKQVRKP